VAPVEVRVKSLGPGFCAVEVTGGGNTLSMGCAHETENKAR
jgi:hypothetical protein